MEICEIGASDSNVAEELSLDTVSLDK